MNFLETLNQLDKLYEADLSGQDIPAEIQQLISQGVPVYTEEPDFIKEETVDLAEDLKDWSSRAGLELHYSKHVLKETERLDIADINSNYFDFKCPKWTEQEYSDFASNLANSPVGWNVGAFICQTKEYVDDNDHEAGSKHYANGITKPNRNIAFRVCKYKIKSPFKIPSRDLCYKGDPDALPTEFKFSGLAYADYDVCEVVYYSIEHVFGTNRANKLTSNFKTSILSYFFKRKSLIDDDLLSNINELDLKHSRDISNDLNLEDTAKTLSRQPVYIMLSFASKDGKVYIRADLYNNIRKIQKYFIKNTNAFFIGLYNGKHLQMASGTQIGSKLEQRSDALKRWIGDRSKIPEALKPIIMQVYYTIVDHPRGQTFTGESAYLPLIEKLINLIEYKYYSDTWQQPKYLYIDNTAESDPYDNDPTPLYSVLFDGEQVFDVDGSSNEPPTMLARSAIRRRVQN